MINRKYPSTRLRRLRQSKTIRDLVAENTVSSNDLIEPMFLVNSKSDAGPVNSMPVLRGLKKISFLEKSRKVLNMASRRLLFFQLYQVI